MKVCPFCGSEYCYETEQEAKLAALKTLVREMGAIIAGSRIHYFGFKKVCEVVGFNSGRDMAIQNLIETDELLNRPMVKALLSPPPEPDRQPEKG